MKLTLTALFFGLAASKSSKPGQCTKTNPCDNGVCVSVQSNIDNLVKASQCTVDPICGGNKGVASCPTFSSWPPTYQGIESVCLFVDPANCAPFGEIGNDDDGTVTCYNVSSNTANVTYEEYGIYKCVDLEIFKDSNFPLKEDALEACAGNSTESNLCNGQGTCSPVADLSVEYGCTCNLGFSATDNCLTATSNSCNNLGQCGEGGECNTSTNKCDCEPGIGGNQCSECVSDVACNDGVCTAGVCVCDEGFIGDFCTRKVAGDSSEAGSLATSGLLAVLVTVLAAAF